MIPEFRIDFGQFTFDRIYQVFLPLVPGGTLVCGMVLACPEYVQWVTIALGLGRYSVIGLLILVSYVAGLLLYGFGVFLAWIFALSVWKLLRKYLPPKRNNLALSQPPAWRRPAARFLGPDLIPHWPGATGSAEEIATFSLAVATTSDPGWDDEWKDWYNSLQDHVLGGRALLAPKEIQLFGAHLHPTGWALIWLYFKTPLRDHWSVALLAWTVIFAAAAWRLVSVYAYWNGDRLVYWDFVARLLHALRVSEAGVREEGSHGPPH